MAKYIYIYNTYCYNFEHNKQVMFGTIAVQYIKHNKQVMFGTIAVQ